MTKATPCITKGYLVGDRFEVIDPRAVFSVGSIIELHEDDGTSCPKFRLISGTCQFDNCYYNGKQVPGAYESLQYVTKIEDNAVTKSIIAVEGIDITAGKEYPVYTSGRAEYFRDDVGDERSVVGQRCRGARYKDAATSPGHDRGGFKPGDRVECIIDDAFVGKVPRGTRGLVVEPRDPGTNVRWDNGFAVKDGSATISPDDLRKVTDERATPWADAPEWATYYGIEPSGRHFWFNLPPIELNNRRGEFARGLDTCRGNRHREITPRIADHNGTFYVEARPVAQQAEVTPQSEAKYLIRILKCGNSLVQGSFIEQLSDYGRITGNAVNKDNRKQARRFTYEQVVAFLRRRSELGKDGDFEVLLDFIKTGAAKPEPRRGNGGHEVGTILRCRVSGHHEIVVDQHYRVESIDSDGDELIVPVDTHEHTHRQNLRFPSLASNPEFALATVFTVSN